LGLYGREQPIDQLIYALGRDGKKAALKMPRRVMSTVTEGRSYT